MNVFVIVALAVVLLSLGAVGVAAVALRRAVRDLADAGRTASERVRPLSEELEAESAVTALEVAALQRTRDAGRARGRGAGAPRSRAAGQTARRGE